jgi:hypothetical protein
MSLVVESRWLEQVDRGADNPTSYIPNHHETRKGGQGPIQGCSVTDDKMFPKLTPQWRTCRTHLCREINENNFIYHTSVSTCSETARTASGGTKERQVEQIVSTCRAKCFSWWNKLRPNEWASWIVSQLSVPLLIPLYCVSRILKPISVEIYAKERKKQIRRVWYKKRLRGKENGFRSPFCLVGLWNDCTVV